MNALLLMLFLTSPQMVTGNLLLQSTLPEKLIPVTIRVNFGPAGKGSLEKQITVKNHATPKEALSQILPVEAGATCCHAGEVKAIDGISVDPLHNRWWRLNINGSPKHASPHKSRLKEGDLVEWIYFEDLQ